MLFASRLICRGDIDLESLPKELSIELASNPMEFPMGFVGLLFVELAGVIDAELVGVIFTNIG